jgi:hypothetical protein
MIIVIIIIIFTTTIIIIFTTTIIIIIIIIIITPSLASAGIHFPGWEAEVEPVCCTSYLENKMEAYVAKHADKSVIHTDNGACFSAR